MRASNKSLGAGAVLFAAVTAVAVIGSLFNPAKGRTRRWYRGLRKPSFNPPNPVFPIAWSALYPLMAYSAWRVWRKGSGPARTRAIAWWSGQLALNAAWSPLFFGARRPALALVDLAGLFVGISGYARAAHRIDPAAGWMMAPYLAWVGFAGVLNAEIARRN